MKLALRVGKDVIRQQPITYLDQRLVEIVSTRVIARGALGHMISPLENPGSIAPCPWEHFFGKIAKLPQSDAL